MDYKVLFVDDNEAIRRSAEKGLLRAGFHVTLGEGGEQALELLRENLYDIVVCDLRMPDVDGLDVLRFSRSLAPPPAFIVMTAYASVQVAVKAMKYGAEDFIEKPIGMDELCATIHAVLRRRSEEEDSENREVDKLPEGLVGDKAWLEPFTQTIQRISRTDSTVLIEGETGTGKSATARSIWQFSPRSEGPLVEVNCAAIPEHLLESELFGHVKGSFTGATTNRVGKVELANGGTLFLDEIAELKPDLQSKLLHLLQDRSYQQVGSSHTRQADVRFIAATNRNLAEEVEHRRFRADLYYRINVLSLRIPPLRERPADVPILIDFFSRRVAKRLKSKPVVFSSETIEILKEYSWPGNVRELLNLVERMAVMYPESTIVPEHLSERIRYSVAPLPVPYHAELQSIQKSPKPFEIPKEPRAEDVFSSSGSDDGINLSEAVRNYEESLIRQALKEADGNKSQAARMLNMKRTTLIDKCKKLGIA